MLIRFHIHFHTDWGQQMFLSSSFSIPGSDQEESVHPMEHQADGTWELELEMPDEATELVYRYGIFHGNTEIWEWEFRVNRNIDLPGDGGHLINLYDQWHSSWEEGNALLSSAFTKVLQGRPTPKSSSPTRSGPSYRIQLRAPEVSPNLQVGILGSDPLLGNWEAKAVQELSDASFPLWSLDLPIRGKSREIEYKFVLIDRETKKIVKWEEGENRSLHFQSTRKRKLLSVFTAEGFRGGSHLWRGAGVAIPVFSLRTEESGGIGEFLDLKEFADWAHHCQLRMIQILPINDTIATHTWIDSYPYSAISVFALHPIYIRPSAIAKLENKKVREDLEGQLAELNLLPEVDFDAVIKAKSHYLKLLYDQEKESFLQDSGFLQFFNKNEEWLVPYAAFSALRDKMGTADFSQWKEFAEYDEERIAEFTHSDAANYDDIAIHYFIQYHLHLQLLEASSYANQNGIILKGDIPIGIYRHSVDAWVAPHLYFMDAQAGAPPDDFAVEGQNWRFPTYNWEEMAKDGYAWWRKRMVQLSTYFDAYRIDHILGFFRIWEIPGHAVQGLLGQFNPALPLSHDELLAHGIWVDEERFCEPYIRQHFLHEYLGMYSESAAHEFMDEYQPGCYRMKPQFATQRQIEAYAEAKMRDYPESRPYFEAVVPGLYGLLGEVLFLRSKNGHGYSPRIALQHTRSYQELNWDQKERINRLYDDFFYHRHEYFWREQAMTKLPAICEATDMLVCGEDLGMVPACVPGVMRDLGLLSLEIQRMPKEPSKTFGHPADAPYLSVVSPSSHDMPTIRGWWEQDRELTQRFFQEILGHWEEAPYFCEPWVAQEMITQHLYSPAMWAIFPIQDLLAIDGEIRRENPHIEQINVPANPKNYWRYRLHLSSKELLAASSFNQLLRNMIEVSGRAHSSGKLHSEQSLTSVTVNS